MSRPNRYVLQYFQALVYFQSISQCSGSWISNSIHFKTVEKDIPELVQVENACIHLGVFYKQNLKISYSNIYCNAEYLIILILRDSFFNTKHLLFASAITLSAHQQAEELRIGSPDLFLCCLDLGTRLHYIPTQSVRVWWRIRFQALLLLNSNTGTCCSTEVIT